MNRTYSECEKCDYLTKIDRNIKEIEYKNLGLIIIDEEQHFGVNQKEKIK